MWTRRWAGPGGRGPACGWTASAGVANTFAPFAELSYAGPWWEARISAARSYQALASLRNEESIGRESARLRSLRCPSVHGPVPRNTEITAGWEGSRGDWRLRLDGYARRMGNIRLPVLGEAPIEEAVLGDPSFRMVGGGTAAGDRGVVQLGSRPFLHRGKLQLEPGHENGGGHDLRAPLPPGSRNRARRRPGDRTVHVVGAVLGYGRDSRTTPALAVIPVGRSLIMGDEYGGEPLWVVVRRRTTTRRDCGPTSALTWDGGERGGNDPRPGIGS